MRRPAFQFYPADWRSNGNLGRCSWAARGVWIYVMCLLHDQDEYGIIHWPLDDIASALGAPIKLLRELRDKNVLKGVDSGKCKPFVYVPRHGGRDGDPITLVASQKGPIWYSSRMVRDEYVRGKRGENTRIDEDGNLPKPPIGPEPKGTIGAQPIPPIGPEPKPPFGDGPSSSPSSSPSSITAAAPSNTSISRTSPLSANGKTSHSHSHSQSGEGGTGGFSDEVRGEDEEKYGGKYERFRLLIDTDEWMQTLATNGADWQTKCEACRKLFAMMGQPGIDAPQEQFQTDGFLTKKRVGPEVIHLELVNLMDNERSDSDPTALLVARMKNPKIRIGTTGNFQNVTGIDDSKILKSVENPKPHKPRFVAPAPDNYTDGLRKNREREKQEQERRERIWAKHPNWNVNQPEPAGDWQ
jgi:hypothetical protein